MEKIKIINNVFIPMPVVLVGAQVEGKANFLAAGWVSRVNAQPPMIAVALNPNHHTSRGIRQTGNFSVCLPGVDLVAATDYCGLVSGKFKDKSGLFEVFYGDTGTAPMIRECPLCLECKLAQTVALPTNHLFIGEILNSWSEERYLTNGNPDPAKMDPFLLTMLDNTYWRLGAKVGQAWEIGWKLEAGNP